MSSSNLPSLHISPLKEAGIIIFLAAIWGASFLFMRILVPIIPPIACRFSILFIAVAVMAIKIVRATTIVEWPKEKNRPTPTGRFFSCSSLRVTLSIAEIWSASNA